MTLSESQQDLYDAVMNGQDVFITGPAGTGKSFLMRDVVEGLEDHGKFVAVTASTGIAAVHIGGRTIHSFLGTRLCGNIHQLEQILDTPSIKYNSKLRNRIRKMDVLVLDEVSMLSGDYIEMMDFWLRRVRQQDRPFGGLQMVFCGDFLQLPPVVTAADRMPHFQRAFHAPAWNMAKLYTNQLRECFRQKDLGFVQMLLEIRAGLASDATLATINQRVRAPLEDPTRLFARNAEVHTHNMMKLGELEGEPQCYEADFVGDHRYFEQLERCASVPAQLFLKIGALVLFCVNHPHGLFVNGTLGRVLKMWDSEVLVGIIEEDGTMTKQVHLDAVNFDYQDGDGHAIASMFQIPVKLAWALTIHKSQGMTLRRLQVDLHNVFVGGHAYVALSRVQSLEGLSLDQPLTRNMIRADRAALSYYQDLEPVATKTKTATELGEGT